MLDSWHYDYTWRPPHKREKSCCVLRIRYQFDLEGGEGKRTFEDRSHVFNLVPHKGNLKTSQPIKYILGIGKRGNIEEAFPSMEYRFVPEKLTVTTDQYVCFAWAGSKHHRKGNDGNGENRDATNVCFVKLDEDQGDCNFVVPRDDCDSLKISAAENTADINVMLNKGCGSKGKLLDDAPPSCNVPCFKIRERGKYCYISTRNSNFSNREHRGEITVI